MKKTISVKWVIICLCLISVFTALFVVSRLVVDAKNQKDTLIQRDGPTLKVGRYYIDGDTEQYYLEVTKEGTIQLCNIDYYEYSMLGNKDILSYSKEIQDGIKEEATIVKTSSLAILFDIFAYVSISSKVNASMADSSPCLAAAIRFVLRFNACFFFVSSLGDIFIGRSTVPDNDKALKIIDEYLGILFFFANMCIISILFCTWNIIDTPTLKSSHAPRNIF